MIAWMLAAALAAPCEALTNVVVHLADGPVADAHVAWSDGVITSVGAGPAPAGCTATAAPGRQVTAGLVSVGLQLGLVEIELEPSTRDDAWDHDPVRAALQVAWAYNPRSAVVPVSRMGGLTSALVTPTGGLVSGQAAWVATAASTQADAVVKPSAAVVVHLDGLDSRAAAWTRLRELIQDARHAAASGALRSWQGLDQHGASRLDLEVLARVARKELPLLVHADRAADLEAAIAFAAEQAVDVVVLGAAEGWLVAERLAAAGVGVLVEPLVHGAGSMDQLHGRPDNAARLHAAGVQVGLVHVDTMNARALRFVAGNAVREGLPHAAALEGITRVPARLLGLEDRGDLAVGQRADLALWTGDPLEIASRLEGLWAGGAPVSLRSRQTDLLDAWRTVPRTLTP
ncbi:MAG: amidohydrolase family protein [Alphaproteobacteria bacterium]|nr:amidohydrolase family protein [Alphaproteobacteria bacterium]